MITAALIFGILVYLSAITGTSERFTKEQNEAVDVVCCILIAIHALAIIRLNYPM